LPRATRLKRTEDIRSTRRTGRRFSGNGYRVYFRPNGLSFSRLGIVVGRMRSAVRRNREKRICREFFRKERHHLKEPQDIVIVVEGEHESEQRLARVFDASGVFARA
jgi:ribonuclease P protein component